MNGKDRGSWSFRADDLWPIRPMLHGLSFSAGGLPIVFPTLKSAPTSAQLNVSGAVLQVKDRSKDMMFLDFCED